MSLESRSFDPVLVDVLDRVLDKGIVIDAAVRVSIVGVELLGVDARVVVASIETYLRHADTIAYTEMAAAPRREPPPPLFAEAVESVPAVGPGPSESPVGRDPDPGSAYDAGAAEPRSSSAAAPEPGGEQGAGKERAAPGETDAP